VTFEFIKNYKFTILNNENVWAKGHEPGGVNEKVPVEKAVDEMIARIKAGGGVERFSEERYLKPTPAASWMRPAATTGQAMSTLILPATEEGTPCDRRWRHTAVRPRRRGD